MIIDISQFKKQHKPLIDMGWTGTLGRRFRSNGRLTGEEKEAVIAQAMNSQEGRDALAVSMVEPIRRHLDYAGIGRKLLMVDELPQGALARYERDVAAVAKACIAKRKIGRYELVTEKDVSRLD